METVGTGEYDPFEPSARRDLLVLSRYTDVQAAVR